MTWVRLDDGMSEHPKIIGLSDRAFRVHVRGLCYTARHLTDGQIPAPAAKQWGARAVTELVTTGVWRVSGTGYAIHDYLDWNPSRAEVDDIRTKRAEAGRRGGERSRPPKTKANAQANASDMSEAKRNPVPVLLPNSDETNHSSLLPALTTRARNEQWDGLELVFGYRPIGAEATLWGKLAKQLATMNATSTTITEAARRYRADMPTVTMTPTALVKHYQRLTASKRTNGHKPGTAEHTLELAAAARERERHAGQ